MQGPHTHLSEVTWMEFVHQDSVMMKTTCVSSTTCVLPVLADTSVAHAYVTSHLPGLLQPCHHLFANVKVNGVMGYGVMGYELWVMGF